MFLSRLQNFLGLKRKILAIDIGSTTIKIVELTCGVKNKVYLDNYGYLENYGHLQRINNAFQTSEMKMLEREVAKVISFLLRKMGTKTKEVVFGVPIYSLFATTIELPPMPKEDLKKAVPYQAKQYIPFPLSEAYLDWFIIQPSEEEVKFRNLNKQIVFLLAYPYDVVSRYERIAKFCDLKLKFLELESLALRESIILEKDPIFVLDIGSRVTNLIIYDNQFLRLHRYFDLSSGDLTEIIASGLKVDVWRAEKFKTQVGLRPSEGEKEISNLMYPIIDEILREVSKLIDFYLHKTGRKIKKLILAGGTANMPGFLEYCASQFPELKVEKANGFSKISYPKKLEPFIKYLNAPFSVSTGLGLRYFHKV